MKRLHNGRIDIAQSSYLETGIEDNEIELLVRNPDYYSQ